MKNQIIISKESPFISVQKTFGVSHEVLRMRLRDRIAEHSKIPSDPEIEIVLNALAEIDAVVHIAMPDLAITLSKLELKLLAVLELENRFEDDEDILAIINSNDPVVTHHVQKMELKSAIERLYRIGFIVKSDDGSVPPKIKITHNGKTMLKEKAAKPELFEV